MRGGEHVGGVLNDHTLTCAAAAAQPAVVTWHWPCKAIIQPKPYTSCQLPRKLCAVKCYLHIIKAGYVAFGTWQFRYIHFRYMFFRYMRFRYIECQYRYSHFRYIRNIGTVQSTSVHKMSISVQASSVQNDVDFRWTAWKYFVCCSSAAFEETNFSGKLYKQ